MLSMTKVVILLLLFNAIEYSISEAEDNCNKTGDGKANDAYLCAHHKFGATPPETRSEMPKRSFQAGQGDDEKYCCLNYAISCNEVITARKYCSPNAEWDKYVEDHSQEFMKLCGSKISKDVCSKYHRTVEQSYGCGEYSYSECEDYSWSSFTQLSVNGVILWSSLLASILVVFALI